MFCLSTVFLLSSLQMVLQFGCGIPKNNSPPSNSMNYIVNGEDCVKAMDFLLS